jgi:hypothetical protein
MRQLVVHVRWAPKWVRHGIRAVGETPLAVRPHGATPLLGDVQTVCAAARITYHTLAMAVPAFHVVGASGAQVHGRNRSELRNPFARLRIVCVGRRGENPVCRADAVRGSEGKTCRKDQGCFSQGWICLSSLIHLGWTGSRSRVTSRPNSHESGYGLASSATARRRALRPSTPRYPGRNGIVALPAIWAV